MPSFLENTFAQLQSASGRVVLREIHGTEFVSVSGAELLDQIARARAFLRQAGLAAGDRCALLGANSVRWAAIDLALMAEGVVVVPLYARQAPGELAAMLQDCTPPLLIVSDATLGEAIARSWSAAPRRVTFDELFESVPTGKGIAGPLNERRGDDLVTIIYTSGTSGEPKGVCLNRQNLDHMLSCTTGWMDGLAKSDHEPLRVFQYLPFNFAASWIVMMSCLARETVLTLSTDLNKLAEEIRLSAPHYFFNVPTLLERVKRGVEDLLAERAWFIQTIYTKGRAAWQKQRTLALAEDSGSCSPKSSFSAKSASASGLIFAASSAVPRRLRRKPKNFSACLAFPFGRSTASPKPAASVPWIIRASSPKPIAWAKRFPESR